MKITKREQNRIRRKLYNQDRLDRIQRLGDQKLFCEALKETYLKLENFKEVIRLTRLIRTIDQRLRYISWGNYR